jgi:hypothetical protein
MRLYHRTTAAAAAAILGSGFVDQPEHGDVERPERRSGVRVSDVPPAEDDPPGGGRPFTRRDHRRLTLATGDQRSI